MALGATLYAFTIQLSDVDRGVYEEWESRVARHPSETAEFMVTRLLAYCLEYTEGIAFSDGGVSSTDEPAVLVRDLTGRITTWIDIGAPDADRIHRGSKSAERLVIYTHRDPEKVRNALSGKKIHRVQDIVLHSFEREFIDAAVAVLERRNSMSLSVTERQLYLNINGTDLSGAIRDHHLQ